jgi:hypothetical protein
MLERHHCADLHRYCATDVTPAFGPALLQAVGHPKLSFQARASLFWRWRVHACFGTC